LKPGDEIKVGVMIPKTHLPEYYQGPPGSAAIICIDGLPEGILIFIKDRVVVHIMDMSNSYSSPPVKNTFDGCICHPNDNPMKDLSPEEITNINKNLTKNFQ
jgi:hypothetical protein